MKSSDALPLYRVRRSKIHGTGAFAACDIRKGTRITEYVGDRISHAEADRRYADKADDDNHTFLFTVDNRVVIDGGIGGNEAKYINHSCDPNCETVIDERRVFIEAIRDIRKGDELGYDYLIERDDSDPPNVDVIWACRCGSPKCRGTMLLPRKAKRTRKAKQAGKKAAGKGAQQASKKAAKKVAKKTKQKALRKPVKKVAKKASKEASKKVAKKAAKKVAKTTTRQTPPARVKVAAKRKRASSAGSVGRSSVSTTRKATGRDGVAAKAAVNKVSRPGTSSKDTSARRSGRTVGGSARPSR